MCVLLWGKGYSPAFVSNFQRIMDVLQQTGETEIQVSSHTDSICAPCPHRRGKACESEAHIQELDAKHRAALDLANTSSISWNEAKHLSKKNFVRCVFTLFVRAANGNHWAFASKNLAHFKTVVSPEENTRTSPSGSCNNKWPWALIPAARPVTTSFSVLIEIVLPCKTFCLDPLFNKMREAVSIETLHIIQQMIDKPCTNQIFYPDILKSPPRIEVHGTLISSPRDSSIFTFKPIPIIAWQAPCDSACTSIKMPAIFFAWQWISFGHFT